MGFNECRKTTVPRLLFLGESERRAFPVITVQSGEVVGRNAAALSVGTLRKADPLKRMLKAERSKLEALGENEMCIISFSKASKERRALVLRMSERYVFMYLPMLVFLPQTPTDLLGADGWIGAGIVKTLMSEYTLPRAISSAAVSLIGRRELPVSSFARICSISATLAFSEDVVSASHDRDDSVDVADAFYAFGRALSGFDSRSATELSSPSIEISLSGGVLSVSLYGVELYRAPSSVLSAVEPYSYKDGELTAAFALAIICEIVKGNE